MFRSSDPQVVNEIKLTVVVIFSQGVILCHIIGVQHLHSEIWSAPAESCNRWRATVEYQGTQRTPEWIPSLYFWRRLL